MTRTAADPSMANTCITFRQPVCTPDQITVVYGGAADPMPMPMPMPMMFAKQLQLRMGQANVLRWIDDIMPLCEDGPLGVDDFATHRLTLDDPPAAYDTFRRRKTCSSRDRRRPCP